MNRSDNLNELGAALSKFQGDSKNALKSSSGHGYNYADLAAILDQSRELLSANGLSVVQMPCAAEAGSVGVETMIMHSSGQWVEQSYSMPIPENKRNSAAQNTGSAITYARRYALAAALGIAQTDEDATNNPAYIVDETAKQWIEAGRKDPKVLEQLTDVNYKNFIAMELMK